MKINKLMEEHYRSPTITPQSEVMKKGKIKYRTDFYRLFYKHWKNEHIKRLLKEE